MPTPENAAQQVEEVKIQQEPEKKVTVDGPDAETLFNRLKPTISEAGIGGSASTNTSGI